MPFPPPLFSLALPLHVAYSLTPPQTSSFALNAPPTSHPIFQALPGTRQNNAPRGNSCITCVKLCEP